MRTTVTLADDVTVAVEELRRERAIGVSEAINELARKGLASKAPRPAFVQRTADMGDSYVDYTNVWEAIEALDGPAHIVDLDRLQPAALLGRRTEPLS